MGQGDRGARQDQAQRRRRGRAHPRRHPRLAGQDLSEGGGAVPPRLRGAAQHPQALPAVLALGQPDADASRAQHHRAAGQRGQDRLQRRQARRYLRDPLRRRARPDQLGLYPAVHLRPGYADRLRRCVRQLQADLAADVGDGRRRRLRDGAPAGFRGGGPGDHPVRNADGSVPDGDPAVHQPVPARQRHGEDAAPPDVGVAHDPAGAGRRRGRAGSDARSDHLRRRGLEADPGRRRRGRPDGSRLDHEDPHRRSDDPRLHPALCPGVRGNPARVLHQLRPHRAGGSAGPAPARPCVRVATERPDREGSREARRRLLRCHHLCPARNRALGSDRPRECREQPPARPRAALGKFATADNEEAL